MIWAQIALALLAALGAQNWHRPEGWGLYWTRLGTMGAFAVSLGAGLAWYAMGAISPSFIRATALLGFWGLAAGLLSLAAPPRSETFPDVTAQVAKDTPGRAGKPGLGSRLFQFTPPSAAPRSAERPFPLSAWQWAVALVVALDLLAAGWGLNPAGPLDLYGPSPTAAQARELAQGGRLYIPFAQEQWLKYMRFLHFESFNPGEDFIALRAALLPNTNILDDIPAVNNFDPFLPGRYADWQEMLAQASPEAYGQMLSLMNVGVVGTLSRYEPYGLHFEQAEGAGSLQWANCAWLAHSAAEARQAILGGGLDLEQYVVLEGLDTLPEEDCQAVQPASPGEDGLLEVAVTGQSANHTELSITVASPGWLVIPRVWYPGWRAWVDGQPAALLRANYLFSAVRVPAGSHFIRLAYRPYSFYAGLVLSALSSLLVLAVWLRRPGTGWRLDKEA
jgi:hypothetical protein